MAWRGLSFSHVWIAGGAGWTAWASWLLVAPDTEAAPWCFWIALSTGLGYTVQRAIKHRFDPESLPPMRRAFWEKYSAAMAAGWGTLWAAFTLRFWGVLDLESRIPLLATLAILGLCYAVVPGSRHGLRAHPALKVPLVATAWTLATTPDLTDAAFFTSRWLLVAGLTLPFDVRDLAVDASRIRTVPMVWGATTTLRLSVALLAASSLFFWRGLGLDWDVESLVVGGQGLVAAVFVALPRTATSLERGNEAEREWITGWMLDGVLWLPFLAAL
ncbi:MAG: hypothetical protein ACPG66_03580 [Flavobacteriales bacterium]